MKMNMLVKGIGVGLVAGMIVTAAVVPIDKRKLMRSGTGKTIKTIGQVVDTITGAFD